MVFISGYSSNYSTMPNEWPKQIIILYFMSTNLHSWPVHLRQCLLLWSSRPLPHQSVSPQGLSSRGAAQQHWCIHCHPEIYSPQVNVKNCYTYTCVRVGIQTAFTLSKTRNASLISSSLSVSFIFLAIIVRNSGKSIVPFPEDKTNSDEGFQASASTVCVVTSRF